MLLRSTLKRMDLQDPTKPAKGFTVELGKDRERKYDFVLDANGDHVCDVKHKDDAKLLLSISEGYELHPSIADAVEKASAEAQAKAKAEAEAKAQAELEARNAEIDAMGHDELVAAVTEKNGGKAPKKGTSDGTLREILKAPAGE